MFTKYDALGRVIITGIVALAKNTLRDALQNDANTATFKCWENSTYSGTFPAANNNYYTDLAYPVLAGKTYTLYTLNYYDTYGVWNNATSPPFQIVNNSSCAYTPPQTTPGAYNPELTFVSGKPTVSFVECNGTLLASATYYDIYGRVIQSCERNQTGSAGFDRFTNLYKGLTSNIQKKEHTHFSYMSVPYPTLNEVTDYTYDPAGRPLTYTYTYKFTYPYPGNAAVRNITYAYTPLGQVKSKQIRDDATLMQTVDYTYNIRGWLTKINEPATLNGDLFGMELLYNTQNTLYPNLQNLPCYNGNISAAIWQTSQPYGTTTPVTTGLKAYKYGYDKLNRLLTGDYFEMSGSALSNTAKYSETIINIDNGKSYDRNGNIQGIARNGLQSPNNIIGSVDLLKYTYNGNQLIAVDDNITRDIDNVFWDNGSKYTGTAEYTYDANGNLVTDLNKGILYITYNYLNLPTSITKTGGNRVEYTYDAAGTKRQQQHYVNGTLVKTTDFIANFVYENSVPAWATYDEGRVVLNSYGTANLNEAYLKDHLGNIRVAYYLQAGTLRTRQVNSYYPFGMNIKGLTANSTDNFKPNEYLYNGKMMQDEMGLGWLDYGARFYDAVLGRWHSVDPLAHKPKNVSISPYAYTGNNPISRIDPDGRDWFYYQSQGEKKKSWHWQEGNVAKYTNAKGKEVTSKRGFDYLVTYKVTGKNSEGAVTGSLQLWGDRNPNKGAMVTVNGVFSGNSNYQGMSPIPGGNYMMKLGTRDADGPQKLNPDGSNPIRYDGMQAIPSCP